MTTVSAIPTYADIPLARWVKVVGSVGVAKGEEILSAVSSIAESWVADDIVLDLRESSRIEDGALPALALAGKVASHLGHRLVVLTARPARGVLDRTAYLGSFVVIG